MLKYADENAARYCADIKCILLTEENLPFEDESFDMVISRDMAWTLLEPERIMAEWRRVLKKGGRVLYFDANLQSAAVLMGITFISFSLLHFSPP
ncbi:class I SAM-dependent methyltransferase [Petroclostridium sp. X23]|uniref:class I SAM-dependent methyltransferase n=1 Tax=Petroclostridium sp. X23 TaxID=3045146 RepID=UPI0024AD1773|nr:class I SAM-dependent methyltransferase [Petroclostridium sp. X23]WHH56817.1 class I SAM-dependent methyltransferase [Petroclostridium sp. X23]